MNDDESRQAKVINVLRSQLDQMTEKYNNERLRVLRADKHLNDVDRIALRAERLLQSYAWCKLAKKQTPDKAYSNREPRTYDQEQADALAKKIHVVISHRSDVVDEEGNDVWLGSRTKSR